MHFLIEKRRENIRKTTIIYSIVLFGITLLVTLYLISVDIRNPNLPFGSGWCTLISLFLSPFLITPFYTVRFLTKPKVKELFRENLRKEEGCSSNTIS
jgi:hypothetical protein